MIRKFLDLSTGHLSLETRAWLDEQGVIAAARRVAADPDCMILMGSTPHGWFVYADTDIHALLLELSQRQPTTREVTRA